MTIETTEDRAERILARAERARWVSYVAALVAMFALGMNLTIWITRAIDSCDCADLETVLSHVALPGCASVDDVELVTLTQHNDESPFLTYRCQMQDGGPRPDVSSSPE